MKLLNYNTFGKRLDTEEEEITELKDKWGESIWDDAQRKQTKFMKKDQKQYARLESQTRKKEKVRQHYI